MMKEGEVRPIWIYGYLVLAAVAGTSLVFVPNVWALPIVQTLLAYVVLARDLRRGELGSAVRHMLFWAVVVSVLTILVSIYAHTAASHSVFQGEPYRLEMFTWIETGVGAEGSPALFIPQHLLHYTLVLLLSALTGGLAGLFLGALLLNYMNYYVGSLILMGSDPVIGSFFGWPIWSMVRVAGFVMGAIVAAHFFYVRGIKLDTWRHDAARKVFLWSFALFLADMLIKWLLAPFWRSMLQKALL